MDKILSDSTKVNKKVPGHCLNINGKKRKIITNKENDDRKKKKMSTNSKPIINSELRKILNSYVSKNVKTPQKSFHCNFDEKIDTKQEPLDLHQVILRI